MTTVNYDIQRCAQCDEHLQEYFVKPDGSYLLKFKRCPECTQVYLAKLERGRFANEIRGDIF